MIATIATDQNCSFSFLIFAINGFTRIQSIRTEMERFQKRRVFHSP
jgi:hypothetical protein